MDALRFALRSLRRSPAFALTAVFTIALGIGVNTAVFHLIHTVLLDPLPFREPARLVHVAETHPDFPTFPVSAPDFADWAQSAQSFDGLAAHTFDAMNKWTILGEGEPQPVQVLQASHSLYPLLGVQPLLGRTYTAEEEAAKAPVAVLSEDLWRRVFHADPNIVGRKIRLVQTSFEVIGVVAQHQAYPAWGEVWMPFSLLDPALQQTRRFHALEVIGRLKSGVTVEQAQAEMKTIAARLGRTHADTNATVGAAVAPLDGWITGEVRPVLFIAWAAVGLVLLLTCANVAHLVLVRVWQRSRELAVRSALGAGYGQISRLLLLENLILALAGGALGALLTQLAPSQIQRLRGANLAPETIAFGLIATLVCALLFALPSLLHSRRLNIQQVLKGAALFSTHRPSHISAAVIAAEVALAFAVVTGAGSLYRSFARILDENPGFNPNSVIAADVFRGPDFATVLAPRLRELPGVTAVAAANLAPMSLGPREGSRYSTRYAVQGRPVERGEYPVAQIRWTTPDYFQTLEIPLRQGRFLRQGENGVVINEALARRMFPGQDPVGRNLLMNVVTPSPNVVPVVGVVGDVRDLGLDIEPPPAIYVYSSTNTMTLLIRGGAPQAIRAVLRGLNPEDPLRLFTPVTGLMQESLARRRLALQLLGIFAALAGLLTAIGVYGVVSYSLSQRRSEFAIRLALGARPLHMIQLIAGAFTLPTVLGIAAGAWLASLFSTVLRTQLYKLAPDDPAVFAGAALVLATLVAAAAIRPAASAATVSPMSIQRE
jgi:predicted permease